MATDETAGATTAPAKSARVAEWRTFAVLHGMAQEDADAATKDQLVAQYGADDSTPSEPASGSVKIYAPNRSYDGTVAGVAFAQGVATADRREDRHAIGYFERQGYGIGKRPEDPDLVREPAVSAIEAAAMATVGGRLRDAAVDPQPDDFLPPVNAGEADPHGPFVVSPEIHHDGPAGLRPGVVAVGDPARQSREESEVAEAVLIERQDKGEALGVFGPDTEDMGDLGLSDPGSAEVGRTEAQRLVDAGEVRTKEQLLSGSETPARNAGQAVWADYAVTQGMDPDEAAEASRTELIERYGGEG